MSYRLWAPCPRCTQGRVSGRVVPYYGGVIHEIEDALECTRCGFHDVDEITDMLLDRHEHDDTTRLQEER